MPSSKEMASDLMWSKTDFTTLVLMNCAARGQPRQILNWSLGALHGFSG
jgi:hypothetical protein